MSVPSDPAYLKELQDAAEKNDEAGDWVTPIDPPWFPGVAQPVEEVLKRVGEVRLPSKK